MAIIYIIKAFLIFLTTLLGTLLILPKLRNIALTWVVAKRDSLDNHYTLIDVPDNRRKVHDIPKPLVGGLGMLVMVSLSAIIFVPPADLNLRGFYSSAILLAIIGFLDDFGDIHYRWKFTAQTVAATIMIYYSKTILHSFGNILSLGPVELGVFAIPITILSTIGVINAINMIDGLDGLAGGFSLIAFISFAILAYINGEMELMLLSLSLCGAVMGFLKYNWFPSTLFMGNAGSFFLGFSLTFLAISITQKGDSLVPPVAPLLILAVPIVDTVTVMIKRIIKSKNPFFPDKSHFHHELLNLGLTPKGAVKVILILSIGFSLFAILGTIFKVFEYYMFLVFLAYFVLHFLVSFYIERSHKKGGRGLEIKEKECLG
jgi:UDP-GlcNAc:undecaprenyl-phosphate GlcNAc-1-phosphate transferase